MFINKFFLFQFQSLVLIHENKIRSTEVFEKINNIN